MTRRLKKFQCPSNARGLFRQAAELSLERSEPVYVVGGYVRDRLLGVESFDLDLSVEGDAVAFAESLAERVGGRCEGFTRFGTAIVTAPGFGRVDVASTRRESYPQPGVLPEVERASLGEDLIRRDFTLNSIALRLLPMGKTQWLDPTHGLEDLRKGVLRAHHAKTFEDDPTRIFRAVRFEQRFDFRIEAHTLAWLKASVRGRFLDRVTGERLRNEFRLIFAEPCPERAVRRLRALGVFGAVLPSWKAPGSVRSAPEALSRYAKLRVMVEEPWTVFLGLSTEGLGDNDRRDLADRLTLSGVERKVLFQCDAPARAARKLLKKRGVSMGALHAALQGLRAETRVVLLAGATPTGKRSLLRYEKTLASLKPLLSGKDLIDFGRRPGPEFAALLEEALRLQLDGRLRTRDQAFRWLESRVQEKAKS